MYLTTIHAASTVAPTRIQVPQACVQDGEFGNGSDVCLSHVDQLLEWLREHIVIVCFVCVLFVCDEQLGRFVDIHC